MIPLANHDSSGSILPVSLDGKESCHLQVLVEVNPAASTWKKKIGGGWLSQALIREKIGLLMGYIKIYQVHPITTVNRHRMT
jgi:hypothetical protein